MQHPHWQEETDHLAAIRETIAHLLEEKIAEVQDLTEQEAGINRDMWEEIGSFHDLEGISEFMQYVGQLKQNMALARHNRQEIEKLDRLFLSPYFARIDFGAEGDPIHPCYIGISTLMDDDTASVLIYDWRAPISSLFYDWEPGDVSFQSPAGTVYGSMTLKRQYRLSGGKLVLMFDASLAINDEILQEILAGASGGQMRQIVSSIQKEQNHAIRFEDTRVLAVQGAAGSGKTSIAMHRAAYLLYRHRATIRPENLVILSPNTLLGEYIANVLPELGEERIEGTPFGSLAAETPGLDGYHLETNAELMESILIRPNQKRRDSLSYKSSTEFLQALEDFVARLSAVYPFTDLHFEGKVLISAAELNHLYATDFRSMGIGNRLERIRLRIGEQLNQLERGRSKTRAIEMEDDDISLSTQEARVYGRTTVRQEFFRLREELEENTTLDPVDLYRRFLRAHAPSDRFKETDARLGRHVLFQEDLAPIFLLALATRMLEPEIRVRHVLVDEAQDFTVIQIAALRLLYQKADFTLLGDANQNILTGYAIGSLEKAAAQLHPGSHAVIRLDRTYRCTLPISHLADEFRLEEIDASHFGRPGPLPDLLMPSKEFTEERIVRALLKRAGQEGRRTVAILTRTMSEAEGLYSSLLSHRDPLQEGAVEGKHANTLSGFPLHLVGENFSKSLEGLLILPVWLAKGLEFETVVLVFQKRNAYTSSTETGLFHTACTRALHRLTFLSHDGLPEVLSQIPESLYERNTLSL